MGRKKKKDNKLIYIVISVIAIVCAIYLGKDYISYDEYVNELENNIKQSVDRFASNITNQTEETSTVVEGELKVYYLDVGQADSILMVNNVGTMLIDAGNNEDGELIANYIKSLGINKIDYLVGTHPHEDHIGGLDNIIKNFQIGTIYLPETTTNTKTYEDVLDAIAGKNLKITVPKIGDKFNVGNAECEVLSVKNDNENLNDCSIVIKTLYGKKSFLFMGDAEQDVEAKLKVQDIDVLKVGHHGSSTSSSQILLNKIKPKYAIISVGKDNDYGHPTEQTLKRLDNIGSEIHRTDLEGTILVSTDGENIKIKDIKTNTNGN